jgi:hypothetical protein
MCVDCVLALSKIDQVDPADEPPPRSDTLFIPSKQFSVYSCFFLQSARCRVN